MIISEKKNFERKIFKKLMEKSSSIERKNVEINVKLFIETFIKKGMKINYIGIYWPLKNEVDLRSLHDKYSLALPRCTKNRELLFCVWDDKNLTKDSEGILSPDLSRKLTYKNISMIFIPCLAVDKNLTRLGYGGGYFDRLRRDKNWRTIPCIGILTSHCVSNTLLTRADWDIPLSGFITEKEILV
tara:strand:- start:946 stop:1503 length:558 start_codon:yes stop_codon:yes gene_type:complete